MLTGRRLLLHCMKRRMPALDYLVYQVLHPLRRCQRQGRHLVIQVLVTDLAERRHTDRQFEQQKTNALPKPVESFYKLTYGKGFSLYSTNRAYALQTKTKSVYLPDVCPYMYIYKLRGVIQSAWWEVSTRLG